LDSDQIEHDKLFLVNFLNDENSYIFNVDVMQNNGMFTNLHTVIKITRFQDQDYLQKGKRFGEVVAKCGKSNIRKIDGNHGQLHTYGMHRHNGLLQTFGSMKSIKKDKEVYKEFVEKIMYMAGNYFPIELSTMIQSEYSRGITSNLEDHPCHGLNVNQEGPCSISTSINFATPQHVDIRDGSISVFSWFHVGKPITDGYFVLSNLQLEVDGIFFNGVAIILIDGLLVSGDGRIIRHGTTASQFDGLLFGIQFAANGISMNSRIEEND